MLETPDLRHWGRSDHIHIGLQGLWKFQSQHKRLPEDTEEDIAEVLKNAKEINASQKDNGLHLEEIEETTVKNIAKYAVNEIVPMTAFFGGILAQEIVKFTGKYSPLKQWLHYDIFETLPEGEVDRTPMNGRYDDQIRIYGREIQEKLKKVKTFLVGAGALGCEYVKSFALMGLGCSKEGRVYCTDNDNIEVSNLNRQFLFRKNNVG
jgi:ubiquitin-activating enzyme E1